MERNDYLKLCQKASVKIAIFGNWYGVEWAQNELVKYKESLYIPFAYRMDFKSGEALHIAILHDRRTNTEVSVRMDQVKENEDL